jgi:hypothetical protein
MGIVREHIYEALSFTRKILSPEGLNIGKTALFPEVIEKTYKDHILEKEFISNIDELNEETIVYIDPQRFLELYSEVEGIKKQILDDILDKILTFNPSKVRAYLPDWLNILFSAGKREEVWKNAKWIREDTIEFFKAANYERVFNIVKKLGANKAFSLGIVRWETKYILWALQNGATNVNLNHNEPIQRACQRGDIPIIKELLKQPGVDPAENTAEGLRYKKDEKHPCIRRAAKDGKLEVVEILLKDGRSDPSYRNNFALSAALSNGDVEMVRFLLNDKRVIDNIHYMTPASQSRLKKMDSQGLLT